MSGQTTDVRGSAPALGEAVDLHARVLLMHTGGALWVDAIGMQGPRTDPFVRWLPTSPRVDLGLVGDALAALPGIGDAPRLAHVVVSLSEGPLPAGDSAQAALALAALWFWRASQRGLATARPGAAPGRARRLLAATGPVRQRPGHDGLFRYVIGDVGGIADKVAAVARVASGPVELVVPATCAAEAAAAVAASFPDAIPSAVPRTWLRPAGRVRLHPVTELADLHDVVDLVLAEAGADLAATELEVGAVLEGRFVLRGFLGEGGAGTVWRALDRHEGGPLREVAVKVLHPHLARDPERLAAFFRGARHMQRLGDGVARIVHAPGGHGPHRYVAMQLLGDSLHAAVGRAGLDAVLAVADTLGRAHANGIVHRDVKPHNVLFDEHGAPLVVDFDLSRAVEHGSTTTRALGSLAYCAPEVLTGGAAAARASSDVYSLAMTALFVLHGGDLPLDAVRAPLHFLEGVDAPAAVRWVLARSLASDPTDRPADASVFAAALREGIAAGRGGPRYRAPGSPRRRAWVPAAAAALGVGAAVVGLWPAPEPSPLAERAWRIAESHPAEALALLRAADRLDHAAAAALLAGGGASRVAEAPDRVLSLDVGPAGDVVVGTLGGWLLVLDPATGQERWRVKTPLERVKQVRHLGDTVAAWAPDAQQRGHDDAVVGFYDAVTGAAVAGPEVRDAPKEVALGPVYAAARHDDRVVFWERATRLPVREVLLPADAGAALAPDGDAAVVVGPDALHRVDLHGPTVDAPGGRVDRQIHLFTPDGARFVQGGPAALWVYDAATLALLREVPVVCHRRMILDLHGHHAVCGGLAADASLVDLDTGVVRVLDGLSARLSVAAFLDGAVATGAFDGSVDLWDLDTGAHVGALAGHTALVAAIAPLGPHGLVTGAQDGTVRVWDLTRVWAASTVVARDVDGALARFGDRLAWRDRGLHLRVDGRDVGPIGAFGEAAWSVGGTAVIAGGALSRVAADGADPALLPSNHAAAAVETGAGLRIAFGDPDGRVWIGPVGGPYAVAPLQRAGAVTGLAFVDPDLLVVFPYTGEAVVVDGAGAPRARLAGTSGGVADRVVRGDRLLAGTWAGHAGVWDVRTGERLLTFDGHTEEVVAVDWSADGRRVVTGSWDETARVWDADTGAPVGVVTSAGGDVVDVALAPDGRAVAVLSTDLRTRVYALPDLTALGTQPASRARSVSWDHAGLLTVETDGTARRWRPLDAPADPAGATNLRVCPDGAVVPVQPWPDPATTAAPDAACADRARGVGTAR